MDLKKTVRLGTVDTGNGRFASVYCRVEITDGNLSICGVIGPLASGNALGGCGQIRMGLEADAIKCAPDWNRPMVARFLLLWGLWHLNDMRAGCEHQRACGETRVGMACDVCGYGYGTAWLKETLPEQVVDFFRAVPHTDKTPAWV